MRNGELRLATVLFGVALALGGCQEDDSGGAADSGPGMGGAPGAGGVPGAGGTPGAGGSPGMGGEPGAGGQPGAGGEPGAGGGPGMGGEPGAGGNPGACAMPLGEGEGCTVGEGDCCAAGLDCADPLGEGATCHPACDANADPTGCGMRAVCLAANPDTPVEESSPGICVRGQDCEPGNEALACGGPATCLNLERASFCFPAGERGAGEECGAAGGADAVNNCMAGLVCPNFRFASGGTCSVSCETDADCETGRCLDYTESLDGVPYRFCYEGCSIYGQDCEGATDICLLADDVGGRAVGSCLDGQGQVSNGPATTNQPCTPDNQTYWGNCSAGHLCTNVGTEATPDFRCLGFCDDADSSLCTGGSACTAGLLSLNLGLCFGECNTIGEESGCGDGQYCRFSFRVGKDADGRDRGVGFCTEGAQTKMTGETCTRNMDTGASDCANGHICDTLTEGADTVCIRLCENDPESEHACPPGFDCQTGFFGEEGMESALVGVCIEQRE